MTHPNNIQLLWPMIINTCLYVIYMVMHFITNGLSLPYSLPKPSNISHTLAGNTFLITELLQLHLHSKLNTCHQWIGQSNRMTRRETFKFWDLVQLILHILLFWFVLVTRSVTSDFGPVRPRWVNLSPALLRNGLSVPTATVPVEWKK